MAQKIINAVVINDPFAPDFGMEKKELPFVEGWTLRQYVEENFDQPDELGVYVNLLRPDSMEYVPSETDGLLIGPKLGIGAVAAWIGTLMASIAAGTSMSAFGAGAVAAGVGMSVGTGFMVAGTLLAVAIYAGGMMLVNSLLAPDGPNRGGATGVDNSKAYQWGMINNSAAEMIPKPVGLGTFNISGNLITSRTESYNVEKAGFSIRETLYLLFSCSNNKATALNSVTINGMDASTFADDDISIYYTLGGNDQEALNPETSLSFLPSDPIAPASPGPLFPNLSVEKLLNLELDPPDHVVDVIEGSDTLIGYSYSDSNSAPGVRVQASLRVALTKTETTTIHLQYQTEMGIPVSDFTGFTTPCYAMFSIVDDWTYTPTTEHVLISSVADGGIVGNYQYITLTISGTREYPQAWNTNASVELIPAIPRYAKSYAISTGGSDVWDHLHYVATLSWTAYTSDSSEIEDLEMQFTLPRGMFFVFAGTHSGKDAGAKFARWETYEFHLLQLDKTTSAVVKDIYFTPPDDGADRSIIAKFKTDSPGLPKGFFCYGRYTHAHTFSIKATDIVAAYADFPGLYSAPSGNQITLDANGFLPTGYKYQIKIRIHGHGADRRKGAIYYATLGPNDASGSSDNYETRLYRVKELDYSEVLRYPNQTLLAIALNSTTTTGGQMPTVVANWDFAVKYWNGTAWVEGHTKNPAELATGICYNSLWGGGVGGPESDASKDANMAEKMDLSVWREFAIHCDDTTVTTGPLAGEPNYIFNGLYDSQRPFWDVLTEVCAVANARPYFDGSKISVYWEQDQDIPVQVFNSTTMKQGTYSESYINTVDTVEALNGSFIDEITGEKTALNWIFPLGDPLKTTSVELVGVTNIHRALRAVQYKLNKTNIIKKANSFETWQTAVNCEPGDLIAVENQYVKWGNDDIGGELTAVDSGAAEVTLDRLFVEPTGSKYIMLRSKQDDIETWAVSVWDNTGTTTVLTLSTGTGLSDYDKGALFIVGVGVDAFGKFIAATVDIHGDMSVDISGVQYIEQSQLDSGMFTITESTVPGITRDNFCPRNITLTPDEAETEVTISWTPPKITEQTVNEIQFDILRYQIWRRDGAGASFSLITEVESPPYTDMKVPPGAHYFYKVIPVFNYYGSEAVIPLSWCSNFTDSDGVASGNDDVDAGVDFTWSIYEYLPLPELSSRAEHPNGYLVTANADNETLSDITIFLEDPENWRFHDATEGYSFWLRLNNSDDVSDWFGPTGITLSGGCSAGAATITVSSVSGLTIPGLIILDSRDIVYVHSAVGTTLTLGHPSYYDADDLTRKFTVGTAHASGVSVYNAHKGFFPVRYFGFAEDVEVATDAKQLTCSNIFRYDIATGVVVPSSDWSGIIAAGIANFRAVYSNENIVGMMIQATDSSFISYGQLVPWQGDFSVNLAFKDITGLPNGLYSAVWNRLSLENKEILKDKNGELYFTIQGLPQIDNCWFAINRVIYSAPLGSADYGWTSHIKPVGI